MADDQSKDPDGAEVLKSFVEGVTTERKTAGTGHTTGAEQSAGPEREAGSARASGAERPADREQAAPGKDASGKTDDVKSRTASGAEGAGQKPDDRKPDAERSAGSKAEADRTAGAKPETGKTAATESTPGDGQVFKLLDKAFEKVDWGWKNKQGDDRDLGRLSYINAQKAWVEAAMEDPKRADEMWRKKTGGPVKSDMEKMLTERRSQGATKPGTTAIDSLANDVADLANRRNLSDSKTRKTALRSSLGEWGIMRGDAQQRSLQAKRARQNEIWSPESSGEDDGMHLVKSFMKGAMTHHERTQQAVEKNKAKDTGKALKEIQNELGRVTTQIKKFETDLNVPMKERDSIGIVGKSRKSVENTRTYKMSVGATKVAGKAGMAVGKVAKVVAQKGAELAKGAAIQGAAIVSSPGSIDGNQGSAAYQQRMAAFRQFQHSRGGMGSPPA